MFVYELCRYNPEPFAKVNIRLFCSSLERAKEVANNIANANGSILWDDVSQVSQVYYIGNHGDKRYSIYKRPIL